MNTTIEYFNEKAEHCFADAFTIKTGSDASRIVRGGDAKSNTSQVGSARISSAPVTPNNTAAGYTFRIAYIVPKSGE